jgi:hypothetical protein
MTPRRRARAGPAQTAGFVGACTPSAATRSRSRARGGRHRPCRPRGLGAAACVLARTGTRRADALPDGTGIDRARTIGLERAAWMVSFAHPCVVPPTRDRDAPGVLGFLRDRRVASPNKRRQFVIADRERAPRLYRERMRRVVAHRAHRPCNIDEPIWLDGSPSPKGVADGPRQPGVAQQATPTGRRKRLCSYRVRGLQTSSRIVSRAVLKAFSFARTLRDAYLLWPTRLGPQLAAAFDLDAGAVTAYLEDHVRQLLTELASERCDF